MEKKPIMITWLDSHSPAGEVWIDPVDIVYKLIKIKTVGFVIKETKKTITLASSVCASKATDQVSGVMCIPKCAITKRNDDW